MKFTTNQLKQGLKILIDGEPCSVISHEFHKPGKGQAVVRTKLYNLRTEKVWESDSTILGSVSDWLDGEEECKILFWNDSVLRLEPPTFVFKEIIDTEPGLKGDTVSNTLKPAKIVSGKEIQVPIFINIGDTIKIDTRDGSYVSRNNE